MRKFRKKPVVVEAFRLGFDTCPPGEWWNGRVPKELEYDLRPPGAPGLLPAGFGSAWHGITIPTLEGDHIAMAGDWIIKGVAGEVYPCRDDIFQQTYEEVTE